MDTIEVRQTDNKWRPCLQDPVTYRPLGQGGCPLPHQNSVFGMPNGRGLAENLRKRHRTPAESSVGPQFAVAVFGTVKCLRADAHPITTQNTTGKRVPKKFSVTGQRNQHSRDYDYKKPIPILSGRTGTLVRNFVNVMLFLPTYFCLDSARKSNSF